MHDAEVRVFSGSVPCMGKGVMNEPEVKFTKRWTGIWNKTGIRPFQLIFQE